MKIIKKVIAPVILSFILLFAFFIGSTQEAKALKVSITITIGGGHSGYQNCPSGGLICVKVDVSAVTANIEGEAELTANNLTLTFAPPEELKALTKEQRMFEITENIPLDPELAQYLGGNDVVIQAGMYYISLGDCTAELILARAPQ